MKLFSYANSLTVEEAVAALGEECRPLAGGTDLLHLMKNGLAGPDRLVNLKTIAGLDRAEEREDGLRIGALTSLADLAEHPAVAGSPGLGCLREAILRSASPQLRHMATIGGNLLQKPRCWYFRNPLTHCWLKGGQRCFAVRGENKYHAILGRGACQAVHPSDPAVAMVALDAIVTAVGPGASRMFPLPDLFQIPQRDARSQTTLAADELITEVISPAQDRDSRSVYVKIAERSAWDFALVSAAVRLAIGDGVVRKARVVLGGVGPMPWRAEAAEAVLLGSRLTEEIVEQSADAAVEGARPLEHNGYKVDVARGAVRQALRELA